MLKEKSRFWKLIGAISFILIFLTIYYVFYRGFEYYPGIENIMGFIPLTILISLSIGLSGYMGHKYFAIILFLFNIMGLKYMLYVSGQESQAMLDTIAGLISYLIILSIGMVMGFFIEILFRIISKSKK